MKVRKFLIAGMLCAGLFACSNDKIDGTDTGKEPVEGDGYMKLVLSDKTRTRTDGPEGGAGLISESAINEVLIIMDYSQDGTEAPAGTMDNKRFDGKIDQRQVISGNRLHENGNGMVSVSPFPVKEGFYRVWVIANPTEDQKKSELGRKPEEVIMHNVASLEFTRDGKQILGATGASDGKFVMFNTAAPNDTAIYAEIEVDSNSTFENPAKNGSPIVLERLAAKIDSKVAANIAIEQSLYDQYDELNAGKSDIEILYNGCVLMNGAKEVQLQQKWNDGLMPVFNTDHYNQMMHYRTALWEDGSIVSYGDLTGELDKALAKYYTAGEPTVYYSMENKNDQKRPTSLIHRFTLKDNTKKAADASELDHFYYLCAKASYHTTADEIVAAFKKYYVDENNELNGEEVTDDDLLVFQSELESLTKDKLAAFNNKWDVKVYWEGEMYYIYEIEDQNYFYEDAQGKTVYDRALYRNTIYDLTVTGLAKLGSYLPEKPMTESKWMSVEVKVKDWVLSNNDNIVLQ